MASKNKITASDYAVDDEDERSSFSRILSKSKDNSKASSEAKVVKRSQNAAKSANPSVTSVAELISRSNISSSIVDDLASDLLLNDPQSQSDRSQNVAISSKERRQNVEITKSKRSQTEPSTFNSQPEHSYQRSQNAARTQPEPSQQGGQNVASLLGLDIRDPTLLVGTQRRVFEYLFALTQQFASLKTPRLTLDSISAATGLRETQIHSATKQLRSKGCILLSSRKDGRGGWVEYSLTQLAFDQWIRLENHAKRSHNAARTQSQPSQQTGHKAIHSPSSSSRELNLKESTTTKVPQDFSTIDLEPVQVFGVTASTLGRCVQLYPNLKAEQLEALVGRFAEFAGNPQNRVKNARGFFISLAKQASEGLVPLDHIESSEERLMRLFVEEQQKRRSQKQDFEAQALEIEFHNWEDGLTNPAKLQLVPETPLMTMESPGYRACLREYFIKTLWPNYREEILRDNNPTP